MTVLGPNYPGTLAETGSGVSWTNLSNAGADDAALASVSVVGAQPTKYIRATNFGFAIPGGATITDLLFEVAHRCDTVGGARIDNVLAIKNSVQHGTQQSDDSTLPTTQTVKSFTGLMNGTWTAADWNASTSGFEIQYLGLTSGTIEVNFLRVSVTYTEVDPTDVDLLIETTVEATIFAPDLTVGSLTSPDLHVAETELLAPWFANDTILQLTLQEIEPENLGFAYGLDIDLNLTLQTTETVTDFLATAFINIEVLPSLQEIESPSLFAPSTAFSIELTLQEIELSSLLAPEVTYSVELAPDLQELEPTNFPVETQYGYELELPLQELTTPAIYLLSAYVVPLVDGVLGSTAKYVEVSRSASSILIYGSEPGPFKFNPVALMYRRGGTSHIIHLAQVKPDFVTINALFNFLTPFAELSPEEFTYVSPGGYLKIWNESTILPSLLPYAVDTPAIPIDIQLVTASFPQVAAATFQANRVIL